MEGIAGLLRSETSGGEMGMTRQYPECELTNVDSEEQFS